MKLTEFVDRFPDDDACRAHLESVRWPDGPSCPSCGSIERVTKVAGRAGFYRCLDCKKQFSVTVGTPMHGTHLGLRTWYIAMYLILASSKGISAVKLGEMLGLQYRTAWHLAHRVRAMLAAGERLPLEGIVEADESYIGGKARNLKLGKERPTRGRGTNKPMLFAAIGRDGEARTAVIPSASAVAIDPLLFSWLDRDGTLMTDELAVFGSKMKRHLVVNHGRAEYARSEGGVRVHTNTAESFFGHFKRAVVGVWHHVSAKHLHRYACEHEFRWNRRRDAESAAFRAERIARCLIGQHGRLRLKELLA